MRPGSYMPLYNQRAFERSGELSNEEYTNISTILSTALSGMRVPAIRRSLHFAPYSFDAHQEEARANYDTKYAPIADPDLRPALNVMPFYMTATLRGEFFPDFMREYDLADLAGPMPIEHIPHNSLGMFLVPKDSFRTVLLANYQLEQEARTRYAETPLAQEISPHVEIESYFFLPAQLAFTATDDLLLRLEVTIVL